MPILRGPGQTLLSLLVFCSGWCALVYQTGWLRELRLVFGASTYATSAVLAIFMGGLGLGGAVLGRRADRAPSPLRFYGLLELGVAAGALLSPFLFVAVRKVYFASGGSSTLGSGGALAVRLALSAAVLGLPTFLMGGTLPAAARGVEPSGGYRRNTALLYGVNTLGALCGALATTFFLLERFGTRATVLIAASLNVAVGAAAVCAAARLRRVNSSSKPESGNEDVGSAPGAAHGTGSRSSGAADAAVTAEDDEAPVQPAYVYVAAAFTGFAFFLMEIVWYRMLSPLLGGTTYTFGLILAVALAGIGVGGGVSAFQGRRVRPSVRLFAATCGLEALGVALAFGLGDRVALLALWLRPEGEPGLAAFMAGWALVSAIVVLPGALVAGYQFPLLISLLGRGGERVGSHTGAVYLWNTAGAIAGSLVGGFGLLPALGALGCWRLAVLMLGGLCAGAAALSLRVEGRRRLLLAAAVAPAACATLLLAAEGPTAVWRHSAIGAGLADAPGDRVGRRAWIRDTRYAIGWERDGVESSVAINRQEGFAFVVNGKTDGNAKLDAGTQVMAPLVGAILHPHPRSAMVIGLGTGSSAGWLAAIPTVRRVDVGELEPAIVEVARVCAPVNRDVLSNPKTRVLLGDARELVMTSQESYDLIVSEPSNPYRAGIASLYTREFYEAAADRLSPGGIFLQWVQAYGIDADTLGRVAATLASVFGDVEVWQTSPADLLFVCSAGPKNYSVPALASRVAQEPFRSGLLAAWGVEGVEGFLSGFFATDAFARQALRTWGPRGLNTDDRSPVEFGFVRSLASNQLPLSALHEDARRRGSDRPAVLGGSVDWERVEADRKITLTWQPSFGMLDAGVAAGVYLAYQQGNLAAVVRRWEQGRWRPAVALEHLMLALALAETGDPRAPVLLPRVAAVWPPAAAALQAIHLSRTGSPDPALAALERAVAGFRADPWQPWEVMARALATGREIARARPALASRVYELFATPFSVNILERERVLSLVTISALLDCGHGERALALFEPNVPYSEQVLGYRAACYAETGNPLAGLARRELEAFRKDSAADASAGR